MLMLNRWASGAGRCFVTAFRAAGLAVLMTAGLAPVARADTLTVEVRGVESSAGRMRACLWSGSRGFPDCGRAEPLARTEDAPSEGVRLRFEGLAPGRYAVSVLHDVDNDGRLRTNALGFPQEPIGLSNGLRLGLTGPNFKHSQISVSGDTEVVIVLQ
jgi:uncharacterized protein (DUF2141 family)